MFKINNTTVAEPAVNGVVVTDETIWASNTGRNTKGKMIGDIIARKTHVEVTWPTLSYSAAKTIKDAIESGGEFFEIQYPDIDAGIQGQNDSNPGALKTTTKTVYAGSVPRTLYSLTPKNRRYSGIVIEFIER